MKTDLLPMPGPLSDFLGMVVPGTERDLVGSVEAALIQARRQIQPLVCEWVVTERAHNRTRFFAYTEKGFSNFTSISADAPRFTEARAKALAQKLQDNPNNQNPVIAVYEARRMPK